MTEHLGYDKPAVAGRRSGNSCNGAPGEQDRPRLVVGAEVDEAVLPVFDGLQLGDPLGRNAILVISTAIPDQVCMVS